MALFLPMLTSCFNDEAIWEKFDEIEGRLDSLENQLNSQVDALSALLSDLTTVSSCEENADGSFSVTLSNGTKFNVLAEGTGLSSFISYKEIEGVKYWATYDANGELVVLTDKNGKNIPVETEVDVKVKEGIYYLIINGVEYATGYDAEDVIQVFSSCTPIKDASGQVYALTFTFGEGLEVTVTVDGYQGVIFKLANAGSATAVSEYYVDFATTQTFLMDVKDVVDYVMQIPDGWRVKEYVDELTGESYIDITAPSKETIAADAAVASGDLKVVSVVEGGKAAVSKLSLNTDPFKVYNVTASKAVITPTNGIQKFVYGLTKYDVFDLATLAQTVNGLLSSTGDLPTGINIAEDAIDKTHAEIYGAELEEDGEYVFWVYPALYNEGTDGSDAGFYVTDDKLRTLNIAPISAKISIEDITVLDATVNVRLTGTLTMYAGTAPKTETILEEIIYQINNGIIDPITEPLTYSGPASEFPVKEDVLDMSPNTSYITWVVPVEKDKKTYLASDIIYKEFKTKEVVAGGTLSATIGEFTTDCSSMKTTVSADNAAMIYYAYLSDTEAKRLEGAEDKDKMTKMMASSTFTVVKGSSAEASVDFIKPETKMWLFAVAIANDGKYGEVISKSATTTAVTFNSLALTIDEISIDGKEAKFKVNVSGGTATEFIYWFGKTTDTAFWLNEACCDGSKEGAEIYMAANPDAEAIKAAMRKGGDIAEDGTITLTELSVSSDYVFIVLAKDVTGNYSHCGYKMFETPAINLGSLVKSNSDKWKTTKKWIEDNLVWDKENFGKGSNGLFSSFAIDIKIPTDLTAYISCFGVEATETADIIVEIEEVCSAATTTNPVLMDENGKVLWIYTPDWEDDNGKIHSGRAINIYNFYPHGCALNGQVTYFSSGVHSGTNCPTWENDECSNYAKQSQSIANYCTLDYWINWVKQEYHYEHPEYGRPLTDPAKIQTAAQGMLDSYKPYYEDAKPIIYVNDGAALKVINRNAIGVNDQGEVVDQVILVLKDNEGNYYEPMIFAVPNYFN